MGYRKLSARPRHHAQDDDAIPTFKKLSRPSGGDLGYASARHTHRTLVAGRGAGRPEERDHPALGPSRHPAFGAKGPAHSVRLHLRGDLPGRGKGGGVGAAEMQYPGDVLAPSGDIAAVAPGAHAILLLDQAGWLGSGALIVAANITLLPLPSKCSELNPVENIWQFMRDNWLSNRIFKSYADILDQCCFAWNRLVDQPWRIMSISLRRWAHG